MSPNNNNNYGILAKNFTIVDCHVTALLQRSEAGRQGACSTGKHFTIVIRQHNQQAAARAITFILLFHSQATN